MTSSGAAVFVVFNMGAGRRDRRRALGLTEKTLRAADRPFEILSVSRGRDLPDVAARAVSLASRAGGIVAAAGGDGTLNGVVQAVLPAQIPFGVLPFGTFNYFARANGIPLDTAEALQVLLESAERSVQVGVVNDRLFLVNASLGFYPLLLEDRESFKRQYGRTRWTALASGLWSLVVRGQPQLLIRMEQGGESRVARASTLFVGNNVLQLERLGLAEAQLIEQGRLAGITVHPQGRWRLLGLALRGAAGRLDCAGSIDSFSFREMEVAFVKGRRTAVKIATDGESTHMALPLVFRVAPTSLRLVCPAQSLL